MNPPTDTVEPPQNIGKPQGSNDYLFVVGFCIFALFLFALVYVPHVLKRFQSPREPVTISFGSTNYEYASNRHLLGISRGLDDDVLVTFPMLLYSEVTVPQKEETTAGANGSGCSICLVDYKSEDVVRILPECKHLFHVSCIDTWLRVHPTCPVCRKSPIPVTSTLLDMLG
ncbi:RING-H2 finger protein ATL70-like [Rutidosis leptorrhynchoides]|uniref:RING-H2 finger protein ATL70-like n=1 Tax=Rutidosis leptorrhynchoides TaxID=125765 RepID=UPI003A98DFA9